jgi:AcrR family transcriptional regulator
LIETEQQSARGGARRRALVEAAFRRLADQGFEGLRTRDVATDAGITVATLHYYFPTKESLIRAVVLHGLQRFAVALPRGGSPAQQLRTHLVTVREILKTDQQLTRVLSEVALRAYRDQAMAEVFDASDSRWNWVLREILQQGVAAGDFAADLNVAGAAAVIVATIRGVSLPSRAETRAARIDETFGQLERWLGLGKQR